MEVKVKNIAKVVSAEIRLDGITVLAGFNGTGKSTVCKSAVTVMSAYANLEDKVKKEKITGIYEALTDSFRITESNIRLKSRQQIEDAVIEIIQYIKNNQVMNEEFPERVFNNILNHYEIDLDSDKMLEIIDKINKIMGRSDEEYYKFFINREISLLFRDQTAYLNQGDLVGEIQVLNDLINATVTITGDEVKEFSQNASQLDAPVYIEPLSILDEWANMQLFGRKKKNIYTLLANEEFSEDISFEEYNNRNENLKEVNEILESVTQGTLKSSMPGGVRYAEQNMNGEVKNVNIASGLKIFLMLQRLVANGSIDKNRVLIIDEPEVNLHPKWQVTLAEVLVLLSQKLDVKVLLSTHSPYFLRAMEVYSNNYEMKKYTHYYVMEENQDKRYVSREVSDSLNEVYEELYFPLKELQ